MGFISLLNHIWRNIRYHDLCSFKSYSLHVTMLTLKGLHQLNILLLVLAIFHILYSLVAIVVCKLTTKALTNALQKQDSKWWTSLI